MELYSTATYLCILLDLEKTANGHPPCRLAFRYAKFFAYSLKHYVGNNARASPPPLVASIAGRRRHCRPAVLVVVLVACSRSFFVIISVDLFVSQNYNFIFLIYPSSCLPKPEPESKNSWPRKRVPLKLSPKLVWVRKENIARFPSRNEVRTRAKPWTGADVYPARSSVSPCIFSPFVLSFGSLQ